MAEIEKKESKLKQVLMDVGLGMSLATPLAFIPGIGLPAAIVVGAVAGLTVAYSDEIKSGVKSLLGINQDNSDKQQEKSSTETGDSSEHSKAHDNSTSQMSTLMNIKKESLETTADKMKNQETTTKDIESLGNQHKNMATAAVNSVPAIEIGNEYTPSLSSRSIRAA